VTPADEKRGRVLGDTARRRASSPNRRSRAVIRRPGDQALALLPDRDRRVCTGLCSRNVDRDPRSPVAHVVASGCGRASWIWSSPPEARGDGHPQRALPNDRYEALPIHGQIAKPLTAAVIAPRGAGRRRSVRAIDAESAGHLPYEVFRQLTARTAKLGLGQQYRPACPGPACVRLA
jgi:hypothetical protein